MRKHLVALSFLLLLTACKGFPEWFDSPILSSDSPAEATATSSLPAPSSQPADPSLAPAPPVPINTAAPTTVKVALLLPLSGQAQKLGRSLQDAAMLALSDKYASLSPAQREQTRVLILPKDTQGTPQGALRAAQEAIKEGAQVFLGPLFGPEVESITPLTQAQRIPVLAFTNNRTLARPGMYVMGFRPEQQIERVLSYAASRGIRTFAALLPDDVYGQIVHQTMQQAAAAHRMTITATVFYPRTAQDTKKQLTDILTLSKGTANSKTPYGFEALLVPEGGDRLNMVVRDMTAVNVSPRKLKLLGSGQWDDENTPLSSDLYGGWFAGADPRNRKSFQQHFLKNYTYVPDRLASLAYDTTALVATLAYGGSPSQAFTSATLTEANGFNGPVDGLFRLLPGGESERGLAILEAAPSLPALVDAAPVQFNARSANAR